MSDTVSTSGGKAGTPAGGAPGGNAPEFSVSELSGAIKRALEEGFGYVRLKGEISGYRGPHSSGHCYFALKDDKAKIEAVIWKGVFGRLRFKPEEGMEVIAQGKITTFPGSSKYQIVIEALEPAGAGALMALLEERKRKFAAEGLFDDARKKARPFLPKVVGIVTSPTGAVIRDMLHGFNERFPAHVIVWPVRVQGEGSAAEVAAAIRGFNALVPGGPVPRPDVLIVARGGGSLEDLWGFNDELVVRAAADSQIPLISAVGHETDWTLIDLVADARAPTPTKAAEWAVPKFSELTEQLENLGARQRGSVRRFLAETRTHLKAATRGLPKLENLIAFPRQRFDEADKRLGRALLANTRAHAMRLARTGSRLTPGSLMQRLGRSGERLASVHARAGQALANRLAVRRRGLEGTGHLLHSLSYQSALARGYALVRDADGRMVRRAAGLLTGASISIEFADGQISAEVNGGTSGTSGPAPDPGVKRARPKSPPGSRGGQGSLF
ncbi:MAG: exodeoxyribonuclease VII large subunit [Hyphomicrobium sp.]|nr:exodeoxyribonuclease VII large subunit [Hyphomicrobium sp.]